MQEERWIEATRSGRDRDEEEEVARVTRAHREIERDVLEKMRKIRERESTRVRVARACPYTV